MISHVWVDPLDPREVKDYSLDASAELAAVTDTIVNAIWSLSPEAVAAGVQIHSDSNNETSCTVWLKVAVAEQNASLWNDPGTLLTARCTFDTLEGRTYSRTCQFRVQVR